MSKIYEFIASGFEEIEALTPVDVLRRGGINIQTVSITGIKEVESSHGVTIKTDLLFEEINDFGDADMLLLPGGLPGATNLNSHEGVRNALMQHHASNKLIGAICAAPMVLGSLGILKGKRATCSPGFEKYLDGATYTGELVTVDGNIITGEGPAASLPYAYKILGMFLEESHVWDLQDKMQFNHLLNP